MDFQLGLGLSLSLPRATGIRLSSDQLSINATPPEELEAEPVAERENTFTQELETPGPLRGPTRGLITVAPPLMSCARLFITQATFAGSEESEDWLEFVRGQSGFDARDPISVLRAIVTAYQGYNIHYDGAPNPRQGEDPLNSHLHTPTEILRRANRGIDCRESSLLVAATLESLGFHPVFVIRSEHMIAAIILDADQVVPSELTVEIPTANGPVRLLPIQADFLVIEPPNNGLNPDPYNFDSALESGREFTRDQGQVYGSIFMTPSGEVLLHRESSSYLGAPSDEGPQNFDLLR